MEKTFRFTTGGRLFYIVVRPISDAEADNPADAPAIGFYAEFSENVPSWLTAEFVRDAQGKCRIFDSVALALAAAKEVIGQRVGGGGG